MDNPCFWSHDDGSFLVVNFEVVEFGLVLIAQQEIVAILPSFQKIVHQTSFIGIVLVSLRIGLSEKKAKIQESSLYPTVILDYEERIDGRFNLVLWFQIRIRLSLYPFAVCFVRMNGLAGDFCLAAFAINLCWSAVHESQNQDQKQGKSRFSLDGQPASTLSYEDYHHQIINIKTEAGDVLGLQEYLMDAETC